MPSLPNKYIPLEHEPRIREAWEKSRAFHADPAKVVSGEKPPYSIVIPPPNVTDRLHLGHALNNTLQDILARAHRMKGFETLWMPGTDHAGIATQTVVEKRVQKETGKKRTDFPREEFVAKIQAFKDEYEAIITGQLKAMGCSCDWDRQRFTMDPVCARAVREAFFRLFKDGLIYRGKRLVNWDPVTQTALADDEVEMEEIDGHFYYLRYPLCHGKNGAGLKGVIPVTWDELTRRGYPGAENHPESEQAWVTVATTRPETYLGDTAVAINPKDPRANALKGLHVELPLVGRVIPIVEDDYVVLPASMQADPEAAKNDPKAQFATGFLKVTPAHDTNDYELGRRHNLGVINVMAPDASISDKHGWTDIGDAHLFVGLSREAARKKVIEEFKARTVGGEPLLADRKPYKHSVGHSYRSHAAIEPYLSDQWYVKVTDDRLKGAALRAMAPEQRSGTPSIGAPIASSGSGVRSGGLRNGDGQLHTYPERYAKTYEHWHENIRDWCISRQLWWGHRIPVWRLRSKWNGKTWSAFVDLLSSGCDHIINGEYESHGALRVVDVNTGNDIDPKLALNERQLPPGEYEILVCYNTHIDIDGPRLEEYGFRRDPDVLDTWFSSALWPISTMGWPDPAAAGADFKNLLEAYNPTNVLCTAREIITLWVSRMVMFNRYFMGEGSGNGPLPFSDVFIHAMIQDGEGRKMSKSLGNGVNPLDIIQSHGTDAMRYVLCKMTTQTQDVRMPVVFDKEKNCNTSPKFDEGRNFVTKLFNAAKFVMMKLEESSAGTGAGGGQLTLPDRWILSRLARATGTVNHALATYEFSTVAETLYQLLWWDFCDWYLEAIKPTIKDNPAQQAVAKNVLDAILRLLHPVCPFITEVLHPALAEFKTGDVPGLTLNGSHKAGVDLLCVQAWPQVDNAKLINAAAEAEFEHLRSLTEAIRQVRASQTVEPRRKIILHTDAITLTKLTVGAGLVETLAGLEKVETGPVSAGTPSTVFTFDGREHALTNLKDAADPLVERKNLEESIKKLEQAIGVLEGRLANPGYAERAPAKMVEETKSQLAQKSAEREAARKRLQEIG